MSMTDLELKNLKLLVLKAKTFEEIYGLIINESWKKFTVNTVPEVKTISTNPWVSPNTNTGNETGSAPWTKYPIGIGRGGGGGTTTSNTNMSHEEYLKQMLDIIKKEYQAAKNA